MERVEKFKFVMLFKRNGVIYAAEVSLGAGPVGCGYGYNHNYYAIGKRNKRGAE
jgi:hypothetical protein